MSEPKERHGTFIPLNDMFDHVKNQKPTHKIFITDETVDQLFQFLVKTGRTDPDLERIEAHRDIFAAGLVDMIDCEINWRYDGEQKGPRWDQFRVILRPDYQTVINDESRDTVVIGYVSLANMILPLAAFQDTPYIGYGDIYFEDHTSVNLSAPDSDNPSGPALKNMFLYLTTIWYTIQVAALDGLTRSLFVPVEDPDKEVDACYALKGTDIKRKIS